MRANRIPFDQQLDLIMECRRSGLSDSQWCLEHDINLGTFYNWVKRHRAKACDSIPSARAGRKSTVQMQEVVRIDPAQLSPQLPGHPLQEEGSLMHPVQGPCHTHALEIELGGAVIRISNEISPGLLSQTLRILKGMSC